MTKKTIRKTTRTADGGQIYSRTINSASDASHAYGRRPGKTDPKIAQELGKASTYAFSPGNKKLADDFGEISRTTSLRKSAIEDKYAAKKAARYAGPPVKPKPNPKGK